MRWRPPSHGLPLQTVTVIALATFALGAGCIESSATDCPSYVVHPDGGVSGFTSLGEWRSDQLCASYCRRDYLVCQQLTATSVKCQEACL